MQPASQPVPQLLNSDEVEIQEDQRVDQEEVEDIWPEEQGRALFDASEIYSDAQNSRSSTSDLTQAEADSREDEWL